MSNDFELPLYRRQIHPLCEFLKDKATILDQDHVYVRGAVNGEIDSNYSRSF